jgi:hypothetical protein
MKEYRSININDMVRVKLTEMGKEIYFHQYDNLNKLLGKEIVKPSYPNIDSEEYSNFQLWHLMKIYGESLELGKTVTNNTLPFETNILIEDKQ